MNETEFQIWHPVLYIITIPIMLFTLTLMIGWNLYFIVQSWRVYNEYKTCKRTPVLHPLYSDIQYLSKQRKLYNLKTHITKYLIMICCSFVEIASIVAYGIFGILNSIKRPYVKNRQLNFLFESMHCFVNHGFNKFYTVNIVVIDMSLLSSALLLTFLVILSRYLAARYLNHPFKRTLIKYLIWCCVQCILIGFCSTPYTWIFLLLLVPIISIANWIVLLRDTSILSRVLRSNLRDIQLYSDNRVFYNQQLSAFKFYRIFRIVSLVSQLFYILSTMVYFTSHFFYLFWYGSCDLNISHETITLSLQKHNSLFLKHILLVIDAIFLFIYSVTLSLPFYAITFIPIILKCVKRCSEKEDQYRYNYDKLQPLLKRFH